MKSIIGIAAILLATMPALLAAAPPEIQVELEVVDKGATATTGSYLGVRLQFSEEKPAAVTKTPAAVAAKFATIKIGPKANTKTIVFMLDEPVVGQATKLYVDANANGDLTDDPVPDWVATPGRDAKGIQFTRMKGSVTVPINYGDTQRHLGLGLYKKDLFTPEQPAKSTVLFYWSEYHRDAKVTLGDKVYSAVFVDRRVTGDFTTPQTALAIDLNADGKYGGGEEFVTSKPFNIGGTTYEFKNIAPDGSRFTLVKSSLNVDETLAQIDTSVGRTVPNLKVTTTDGTAIQLLSTYKGKLVMFDFWATWCVPCLKEMPNLVKAYNQFKGDGFEVLGISLDQGNLLEKVKTVAGQNSMTWKQVYDGKGWQASLASTFGIKSIPSAFLIDGNTGEILASGGTLRGEKLAATVAALLKQRTQK